MYSSFSLQTSYTLNNLLSSSFSPPALEAAVTASQTPTTYPCYGSEQLDLMANDGIGSDTHSGCLGYPVDVNYRAIRIKVYKNGDQYDNGVMVVISRKRYKHWLTFLDFLTKKLNLMAPVHELYRTDGLRIQHFGQIVSGGSYVAVSQGPFLHRPYGLTIEEREKWNINPKFESLEPGTLDSAESVDIYLKQRGYTSRTGLPFPFDGGLCVSHSLMDLRRSRSPSPKPTVQKSHAEPRKKENNLRISGTLEKNIDMRYTEGDENRKSTSLSKLNINLSPPLGDVDLPETENVTEVSKSTDLLLDRAETLDTRDDDRNRGTEISPAAELTDAHQHIEDDSHNQLIPADAVSTNAPKIQYTDDDSHDELVRQNLVLSKDSEVQPESAVHIPESSREIATTTQNSVSASVNEEVQATNRNCLPSAYPEQTIITIANDEASVRSSSNSVIVVNITAGHDKRKDIASNESNNNRSFVEVIPAPTYQTAKIEDSRHVECRVTPYLSSISDVQPSELESITAAESSSTLPSKAEIIHPKTPVTTATDESLTTQPVSDMNHNDNCAQVTTQQEDNKNENFELQEVTECAPSTKSSSRKCSSAENSNLINESEKLQNELEKQELIVEERKQQEVEIEDPGEKQHGKNDLHFMKDNAEAGDLTNNQNAETIQYPISKSSLQQRESENVPKNSESVLENGTAKRSRSCLSKVSSGRKRWEDDEQCGAVKYTVSNSSKLLTPLATGRSSVDGKRVTLASPFVTSTSQCNDSNSAVVNAEEKLSQQQTTNVNVTATNEIVANSKKKDISRITSGKKKAASLRRNVGEGFEADFSPRYSRKIQRDVIRAKSCRRGIDPDLDVCIRKPSTQRSYDPDFKDYDFI